MKKKIASLFLCALFALTALTGCGGKKATSGEGKKIRYWVKMDASIATDFSNLGETPYAEALEKETGIDIEFIHPSSSGVLEALNIMLVSGDLPDIIEYNWASYGGGIDKLYQEGNIIELTDKLKSCAPDYLALLNENPDIKNVIETKDKKILGFMHLTEDAMMGTNAGLIIRKDWLDELNLPMPETVDDYYNVLKEFKEKKGATVPFSANVLTASGYGAFSGAYGIRTAHYLEGGKVVYGPVEPGYKEFLTLMNKWYKEKLLDNNFSTLDQKTADSNILNGYSGLTVGSAGSGIGVYNSTAKASGSGGAFYGAPYPVLNKGDRPKFGHYSDRVSGEGAVVTKQCKNVDDAVKLLNFGYSEKGRILNNYGIEGITYTEKDGKYIYTDYITNNKDGYSMPRAMGRYMRAAAGGAILQELGYLEQYYGTPEQQQAWKTWADTDAKDHALPYMSVPVDKQSEISAILGDVNTYFTEMTYKFVMGTESLDKFDEYVQNLKAMGADRVTEIYQEIYDEKFAK